MNSSKSWNVTNAFHPQAVENALADERHALSRRHLEPREQVVVLVDGGDRHRPRPARPAQPVDMSAPWIMNGFSECVHVVDQRGSAMTKSGSTHRAARKEETRSRILEVARAHFERDGFEASSFRSIAEDAEVAVGTVALHFDDKKGLLHAALYDDLEHAIEVCLTRGNRGSLAKRLTEIMEPAYEYYGRRPRLSRTLLESSLFAASPWKERFASQAVRVHVRIVAVVEAARSRGDVASDTDVAVFAAAVFSFYYMALIGWAQGQVATPLALYRSMVEQHVRGVLPHE